MNEKGLGDALEFKKANQELYDMLIYTTEWLVLNLKRAGISPPNLPYLQRRIQEIETKIDRIYVEASDESKQEDYADWLRRRGNRTG